MTRPRYETSEECATCALPRRVTPEQEQIVALHRMEHRRADHRRAQWRRYKTRQRSDQVGALHGLACTRLRCRCTPIPVFSRREDAA